MRSQTVAGSQSQAIHLFARDTERTLCGRSSFAVAATTRETWVTCKACQLHLAIRIDKSPEVTRLLREQLAALEADDEGGAE